MVLVQNDDVVEQLLADGADEAPRRRSPPGEELTTIRSRESQGCFRA